MSDNKKPGSNNRRQWVVARGKVTINVTEFMGHVPRFSYQLGRMNHEGKFVPFIGHDMIDDVFAVLKEVVEANEAAIKRAEAKRAEDMAAHQEQESKHLGKNGKKVLEKLRKNSLYGKLDTALDMRTADRRSEKEKEKNRKSWPGHMMTADERAIVERDSMAADMDAALKSLPAALGEQNPGKG